MAEADDWEEDTAQWLFGPYIVHTPHEVGVWQEPTPEVILSEYLNFPREPPKYDVNDVCVELNLVLEVVANLKMMKTASLIISEKRSSLLTTNFHMILGWKLFT